MQTWPQRIKAFSSVREPSRLSTGDTAVDAMLGGGIWGVTELAGQAGTGKTQLAMQLCCMVQMPLELGGLAGQAIYINTESRLPKKRINQIADALTRRFGLSEHDFQQHIHLIEGIHSIDELDEILTEIEQHMMEEQTVRLIVIDSIGALYRVPTAEKPKTFYVQRTQRLMEIAMLIRRYACMWDMPIVVLNQVTDVFETSVLHVKESGLPLCSTGRLVKPALGLVWSECIKTRIFLTRQTISNGAQSSFDARGDQVPLNEDEYPTELLRQIHLLYSPATPSAKMPFYVTADGFSSTPDHSHDEEIFDEMELDQLMQSIEAEYALRQQQT